MRLKSQKKQLWFFLLFGIIFLAAGLFFTYQTAIKPALQVREAQDWQSVPCKIISAEVVRTHRPRTHRTGGAGTSYHARIVYKYEYKGKEYQSDRIGFLLRSGSDASRKIVQKYKTAENPHCYVNPENPSQAVLERSLGWGKFVGWFSLIFVVVGALILFFVIRSVRRYLKTPTVADKSDYLPKLRVFRRINAESTSEITLKPPSVVRVFIVLAAVTVFWNLLVPCTLLDVFHAVTRGNLGELMTPTLIFTIVGAVLLLITLVFFLKLFNPWPLLTIQRTQIPLGSTASVGWRFKGKVSRLKSLTITLRGKEWIRYKSGRGKNRNDRTEQRVFYQKELRRTENAMEIRHGQTQVKIPSDTMHSFNSPRNKLIWEVELHGRINFWPDAKHSFVIAVVPPQVEGY